MGLQLFGTRKCPVTRKAERFFKERGAAFQFVDLAVKGPSPGELSSLAKACGAGALVDEGSKRFRDRGLAYMDYDPLEEILADPSLLRTPVVRNGPKAVVGDDPKAWADLAGLGGGHG